MTAMNVATMMMTGMTAVVTMLMAMNAEGLLWQRG